MKKLIVVLVLTMVAVFTYGQTNAERFELSRNATFRANIQICILKAAFDIIGEDTLTYSPAVVEKRGNLADKVIASSKTYADRFSLYCASSGYLTEESTDDDIQFTVNSVWNDVAGVRWEDE